jgi:hypothetical protein
MKEKPILLEHVGSEAATAVPVVYLDACVYKYAASALPRLIPRKHIVDWGHTKSEMTVHDFRFVNPNEGIQNNPELRAEAVLVEEVADHVKAGRLLAVSHFETIFETWGLPKMDSAQGKFYGASVGEVEAPVKCDRLLFSAGLDPGEMQHSFLSRIRHRRFLELQKPTGAYQGKDCYNCNQLLDAFAIWCAEHNHCDFFLTLDKTLIKHLRRQKRWLNTSIVWPSELLRLIEN